MKYNFETSLNRCHTGAKKWELMYQANPSISKDILPMSVADMEFILAPEISQGLKDYLDTCVLGYTGGYDKFYDSVINWMKNRHNWMIEKNWIVSTTGVVPALNIAVEMLTQEDDGVIIFSPVYGPFTAAVENQGRKAVRISLINQDQNYTIDFEEFEKQAADKNNKLLLFCSPHNPVGRVWTQEELAKIIEIANRHELFICVDEIWNDIIFKGYKHSVLANMPQADLSRIITCTSASKTFNLAGLPLSHIIIADETLREQFQERVNYHHCAAKNALSFKATEIAYTQGQDWLNELITVIDRNQELVINFFAKEFPEIKVFRNEGTYVQWLDFSHLNLKAQDLIKFLVEDAQFIVSPGEAFGPEGKGHIRINLALPSQDLKSNLERLAQAIMK